jgi:hypothetical protein
MEPKGGKNHGRSMLKSEIFMTKIVYEIGEKEKEESEEKT